MVMQGGAHVDQHDRRQRERQGIVDEEDRLRLVHTSFPRQRQRQRNRPEQVHRRAAGRGGGPAAQRHQDDEEVEGVMGPAGGRPLPGRDARHKGRRPSHEADRDAQERETEDREAEGLVQLVGPVLDRAVFHQVGHAQADRHQHHHKRGDQPVERLLGGRIGVRGEGHRGFRWARSRKNRRDVPPSPAAWMRARTSEEPSRHERSWGHRSNQHPICHAVFSLFTARSRV